MRRIALATLACGIAAGAAAQPFAWIPGSTINDDKGDRVVIVNCADGTIETALPGALDGTAWKYTEDNPGKDPFIPSFSPDGKFVYLINGGNSTIVPGPDPNDDGHIRLYNANDVITSLRGGTLPAADSWIQEITIPAGLTDDAVEPVCFTIDGDLDLGFFIDATFENLYTFQINSTTGELTQVNVVDTQETPTPLWVDPTDAFAYFCAVNDEMPVVNIVDTIVTPGEILRTIPVPLPADGNNPGSNDTFAAATCTFPIDVTGTNTNTVVQPPVSPMDLGVLNELWIFSGYTGVQTAPGTITVPPFPPVPVPRLHFSDPFHIYKLDISSGDSDVMELTNSGSPEFTIDPDGDYVVFPPTIQANDNGNGVFAHIGGSTVITRDEVVQTLTLPDEEYFPVIGWMHQTETSIFVSSASEAELPPNITDPDDPPDSYVPAETTSFLYRYDFTSINPKGNDIALTPVVELDRGVNFILGQTDDHLVVGASDTFLVNLIGDLDDSAGVRNSLLYLVDEDSVTPQDDLIEVDLGLVGGAAALQPFAEISSGGPEIVVEFMTNDVTSGATLDLGTTTAGTPVEGTVVIKNTGDENLVFSGLIISPTNGTLTDGLLNTIPPAGMDTFSYLYDAASTGMISTDIRFDSNDSDEPQFQFTFELEVTAATGGPELTAEFGGKPLLDGGTVFFPSSPVGDPALGVITIGNLGDANLTTSNLTGPTGVSVTEGLDATIAPAGNDTFELEATPLSPGSNMYEVSFDNNDGDENPFNFTISITGTTGSPEADLLMGATPVPNGGGPFDFGTVEVGTSPAPTLTFTLENNGDASLNVSNFDAPSGVIVTETLNTSVSPSSSDDFTISMDTSSPQTLNATVSFNTNDADENPYTFTVTGSVTAPPAPEVMVEDQTAVPSVEITNNGGPVNFGSTTQGSAALSRTFLVSNTGNAELTIGSVTVPAGFSVTEPLDSTISSSSSDTFTVELSTANTGIFGGQLGFPTNDSDENPFVFAIGGEITGDSDNRDSGDFDGDDCTDVSDFLILLDNWQTVFAPLGPPALTATDFLALLDNWQLGPGCLK